MVAGPILLIIALERGERFAAEAAGATVLGIVSLTAFCAVYGITARRTGWPGAVLVSWAAFLVCTVVFIPLELPLGTSAAVAVAVVLATVGHLARAGRRYAVDPDAAVKRGDLLAFRLVTTAVLVLVITALAGSLSARVSGLLTPFPVITAVLAGFTHARAGAAAANELLAGLALGLFSFIAFFVLLALLLEPLGTAGAFALATGVALAGHALLIVRQRRRVAARAR